MPEEHKGQDRNLESGPCCFLHFGKPAGEAISSIFGGYILGILAFRSRNIYGGLIAHLGVAWGMDWLAFLNK